MAKKKTEVVRHLLPKKKCFRIGTNLSRCFQGSALHNFGFNYRLSSAKSQKWQSEAICHPGLHHNNAFLNSHLSFSRLYFFQTLLQFAYLIRKLIVVKLSNCRFDWHCFMNLPPALFFSGHFLVGTLFTSKCHFKVRIKFCQLFNSK